MPSGGSKPLDRSIVEGPLARAVWMLAWPTMLQNLIAGLQGVVDHALVGHFVGYAGNAAIGVGIQIFIVVIVFVISVFSGMGVLVARFAGANERDKVNRTVYQAFLAAVALWALLLAPLGWLLAPSLLDVVNAAPAVRAEALPFLRIMFVGSLGMLLFFMVSGALRAAGDARTPLRLGVLLTALNIVCNVAFITGLGPLPRLAHHPRAVPLRAAHRRSGDRDEHRGRAAAPIHRLARAERPSASRLCGGVHRAVLLHHVDVGGVDERRRDRGRSEPGGRSSRPRRARRARRGGDRARPRGRDRRPVPHDPALAARAVRHDRPGGRRPGRPVTRLPQCFGAVRHRRPHVHGGTPGHRRHPLAAVHLDRVADRGAARSVRAVPGDARPAPHRHLDGHPVGAHHALRVERAAIPSGKVARDQGGGGAGVSGPTATRREWIGLAVIALPCLLYSMDLTVLNLAVPKLSAALKPTSAQLLWIVDIYG